MKPLFRLAAWSGLLGIALAVLATVGSAAGAPPQTRPAPILVLIIKSDACDCERNSCVAGEQEVINFLSDNPWGFRLQKIDLKERPKATKEFGVVVVPVVVLLDENGNRVARFDGFFSEKDIYGAWEKHAAAASKGAR